MASGLPSPGANLRWLQASDEWVLLGLGSRQGFGDEERVCNPWPVSALHVTLSNAMGILPGAELLPSALVHLDEECFFLFLLDFCT